MQHHALLNDLTFKQTARNAENLHIAAHCVTRRVAVENLAIHKNGRIWGDGQWLVASYKSLAGHPEAM
jgi:hypothetical protein